MAVCEGRAVAAERAAKALQEGQLTMKGQLAQLKGHGQQVRKELIARLIQGNTRQLLRHTLSQWITLVSLSRREAAARLRGSLEEQGRGLVEEKKRQRRKTSELERREPGPDPDPDPNPDPDPDPNPSPNPNPNPNPSPNQAASSRLRAHERLNAEQLAPLFVTMADFEQGLSKVQPSAQREGFATVPDVTWADVGAMHDLRTELHLAVISPIRNPERFSALGLPPACGVLLYGPPGCGKTLLAKAIANEAGASFISVKGPELLNKYVGESEKAVRMLFARGRASAPCVIFFDELDALVPKRGGDSTSQATERLVNQMLTEMDGLDEKKQAFRVRVRVRGRGRVRVTPNQVG